MKHEEGELYGSGYSTYGIVQGVRESIRKFMTDLWRFAKPAQVNEIFFNVLQDSAAKNFEMTDFFKTSFISLTDVRTISISS